MVIGWSILHHDITFRKAQLHQACANWMAKSSGKEKKQVFRSRADGWNSGNFVWKTNLVHWISARLESACAHPGPANRAVESVQKTRRIVAFINSKRFFWKPPPNMIATQIGKYIRFVHIHYQDQISIFGPIHKHRLQRPAQSGYAL